MLSKITIFLILLHLPFNALAENYSNFHQNYLNGTLVESKILNVNHVNSDIQMSIIDKIYKEETERCKEYGIDYNLSDYTFFVKNNPFSIIKISQDKDFDIIINEEEFNCGDDGNAIHRGGTGGHIFKVILNPSKNKISNWISGNTNIPLINEKNNTMSDDGIYNIFARSWTILDNELIISVHGSSCDIAGYKECYQRYKVSFEKGFAEIGDPSTKMK